MAFIYHTTPHIPSEGGSRAVEFVTLETRRNYIVLAHRTRSGLTCGVTSHVRSLVSMFLFLRADTHITFRSITVPTYAGLTRQYLSVLPHGRVASASDLVSGVL